MFNLLGKHYEDTDDVTWKIKGRFVEFYRNGEFFTEVLIEKLIIDFVDNEAHK